MQQLALRRVHVLHRRTAGREHPKQRVVVGLANGVEFVVVAAGTRDGLREEGLAEDVDLVVNEADLLVERVGGSETVEDEAEVSGADRGLVNAKLVVHARRREQVARHVFAHKLVVGNVVVEGTNQVVAVAVRVGNGRVVLGAVGVRVADDVHPVPCPALPIVRRGEVAIGRALKSARRAVLKERANLCGARRQACHSVREAPDQRAAIGRGSARQAVRLEIALDEAIYGVL